MFDWLSEKAFWQAVIGTLITTGVIGLVGFLMPRIARVGAKLWDKIAFLNQRFALARADTLIETLVGDMTIGSDARCLILLGLRQMINIILTSVAAVMAMGLLIIADLRTTGTDEYVRFVILGILLSSLGYLVGVAYATTQRFRQNYIFLTQPEVRLNDIRARATRLYKRFGVTDEEIAAKLSVLSPRPPLPISNPPPS
jgi:hypothetical protein